MYWQQEQECISRAALEQLQLERLQSTLYRVGTHVPFYRRNFREMKLDFDSFNSLADIQN